MGGQQLGTGDARAAAIAAANAKASTPQTSTNVGAIANSGITPGSAAEKQIQDNANAASAQNAALAKTGDLQALSQLRDAPSLYTDPNLQRSYVFGILRNAGYEPTDSLITNYLNGVEILGRNANGGVNYGVNLTENLPINDIAKPAAVKTFSPSDSLGISDKVGYTVSRANVAKAADFSNKAQQGLVNIDTQINDTKKQLDSLRPSDFYAQAGISPDFKPNLTGGEGGEILSYQGETVATLYNSARQQLQDRLGSLESAKSLLGDLATGAGQQAAKAGQGLSNSLSSLAGIGQTNKSYSPVPEAFAQQAGRHFDVNLSDTLGTSEKIGKDNSLVQGIAGPAQDPFGSASEATEGFGSKVDVAGLGLTNEQVRKLNAEFGTFDEGTVPGITNLPSQKGYEGITVTFGDNQKKTFGPREALGGLLEVINEQKKNLPPGQTDFGLTIQGNFAPTITPLTPQERATQKQQFAQSQSELISNLSSAKAKGITSLDITDAAGKVIGTTNPQDLTKARYDILNASLKGPVSVKGQNTTTTTSSTPGKFVDLSKSTYADLVDLGVAKPQTPLDYLNYYGGVAERSFANPIEAGINLVDQTFNSKAKSVGYQPIFNITPTSSDVFFSAANEAARKAGGHGTDIRTPTQIFMEGSKQGIDSIIKDPLKASLEIPGDIGQFIIGGKIAHASTNGVNRLAGKIGESLTSNSVQKAAESGLREGQLEFQVAKPKQSNVFEFEQGTAGKSGKVTDTIPQEFGIGAKGEKVPQLNLPEEIVIPNSAGEGQAKVPLAFINPEKGGSTLIARETIQDALQPNRVLVKGVEPKLADVLGLKPVKNQEGLYIGSATSENLPLIEGAVDTNKIKPVTDFLEVYTKDFKANPEVFGLFAREPHTLIPKNENYPFQAFTRPNVIRYYEGFNGGFERAISSTPLDRRVALNELYPRIRTETSGYIDLASFNPKDFSIVGIGSKGFDRYLTDLGLSTAKRKRVYTPRTGKLPPGVTSDIAERYPLMKSGLTQETQDMIRDIVYDYKPLPKGKVETKLETPLYPLPGLSESTKQKNRKATQQEDQFEVLGYPTHKNNIGTFSDIISPQKSPNKTRTETIHKNITDQFSGLNLKNPLESHNKNKTKSALDLILSLQPAQGIKHKTTQTNTLVQDITTGQAQKGSSTQTQQYGFDYKYETPQKQQQINKFVDTFEFNTPVKPKIPIELSFGGFPNIYGLTTPGKKHGSKSRPSFFRYSVGENPGVIAEAGLPGKIVSLSPNLSFGKKQKKLSLDSLLGTSQYSKRKSKKGLDLL